MTHFIIKQFDIWLADLNPSRGTEPGKTRPVVIIQTDLLNDSHLSTIICPITTNIQPEIELLRVHLKKNQLDKKKYYALFLIAVNFKLEINYILQYLSIKFIIIYNTKLSKKY